MTLYDLSIAVEDLASEAVAKKLAVEALGTNINIRILGKKGSGYIRKNVSSFMKAARHRPFFVLTDLDRASCPTALRSDWFSGSEGRPSNYFIFRIAVREVEAWLLGDTEGFSKFFSVSRSQIPLDVEAISDPKVGLIQAVRASKSRRYEGIFPSATSGRPVGPSYNAFLVEFVESHWSIKRAMKNSDSLRRAHRALQELNAQGPPH